MISKITGLRLLEISGTVFLMDPLTRSVPVLHNKQSVLKYRVVPTIWITDNPHEIDIALYDFAIMQAKNKDPVTYG